MGVVGLITPWNFPSAIPAWKLAPALICGNTVVLKPASLSPLSAMADYRGVSRSRDTEGSAEFRRGSGQAGAALVQSKPGLKAISFTGSCEVGSKLHAEASKRRIRIQLEMGGKNPTVVLADCDFNLAVENVANGVVFFDGTEVHGDQPRHRRRSDLREVCRRAGGADQKDEGRQRAECGHRNGAGGDRRRSWRRIWNISRSGRRKPGSSEVRRRSADGNGSAWRGSLKGYFVAPTMFSAMYRKTGGSRQEEIFGPVAAVMRGEGFRQAMEMANGSPFGLSASVQTTNVSRVFEFVKQMEAGLLTVNLPSAGIEYQLPFGGTKDSSFGPKEQGPAAAEFYSGFQDGVLEVLVCAARFGVCVEGKNRFLWSRLGVGRGATGTGLRRSV